MTSPPALVGALSAGVVDENLAHQHGGHPKEVGPVLQRHAVHIHEPQVDLVDERRRLEGVPWRFASEMAGRHAAQLLIHQGDHAFERRGVSLAPGQEQSRDVVHAARHWLMRGNGSALRFSSYRTTRPKEPP